MLVEKGEGRRNSVEVYQLVQKMVAFVGTTESFIVCSIDGLTTNDKYSYGFWLATSQFELMPYCW